MTRFQDHLRDPAYFRPVRTKLGEALREQYDLMEPVPPGLVELLSKLENSTHRRDTTSARLYARVDECITALADAANRRSRDVGEV
jgi:hypothetical protein